MSAMLGPRVVVAGTHSGAGKTTVATGLLAALAGAPGTGRRRPRSAPTSSTPATTPWPADGRPATSTPGCAASTPSAPLAARAAAGADVLVVEGVMGLFDGAADGTPSSTADIARALDAPVVLVVDAASLSSSVAAVVHGFATLDPTRADRRGGPQPGGVRRPRGAAAGGARPRWASRCWGRCGGTTGWCGGTATSGLVPVAERPDEVAAALDVLAAAVADRVDLAAVVALARLGPADGRRAGRPAPPEHVAARPGSRSPAAGRSRSPTPTRSTPWPRPGPRSSASTPCGTQRLPDGVDGLVVGGGFPETYAAELAANRPLLDDVRRRVTAGLPTWAECGGLGWLCRDLDGHPMAGVVDATATMTDRLHLGYRTATTTVDTPLGPAGTELRGHEFHYSTVDPAGDALELRSRFATRPDGHATPSLVATYLHHHPGGDPSIVANFVAACARAVKG